MKRLVFGVLVMVGLSAPLGAQSGGGPGGHQTFSAYTLPTLSLPQPTGEGLEPPLTMNTGVLPCDWVTRDYELPNPYGVPVYIRRVQHWSGHNLDAKVDVSNSLWITRNSGVTFVNGQGHIPITIHEVSKMVQDRYARPNGEHEKVTTLAPDYVVLKPGDTLTFRTYCSPVDGGYWMQHHELKVYFILNKPSN